jgi:uncharacterized protein YjiK
MIALTLVGLTEASEDISLSNSLVSIEEVSGMEGLEGFSFTALKERMYFAKSSI